MRKPRTSARRDPVQKRPPQRKVIAVALPLLSEREIPLLQGIREGLHGRGNHDIVVLSGGYEASLRRVAEAGELAGAIGEFVSGIWLGSLRERRIPVVQIGSVGAPGIPSFSTDLVAAGREAARVFREGGVKAAAYLGASGPHESGRLGEAFADACRDSGLGVSWSTAFSPPLLSNYLTSLPQPAGLLCASDRLARLAIQSAGEAGLRVPRDLSVIGLGNARMESLSAGVDISSFELPLEEIGRRAGSALADLMESGGGRRKEATGKAVTIPPLLHERASSMRSSSGVTRALAWLRSHPESNVTAGELARLVGMSRRAFETAVRESCGTSPGQLLAGLRQARAEQLLRDTTLGITAVGSACGYPEPAAFSSAFRRWTGKSPSAFRKTRS